MFELQKVADEVSDCILNGKVCLYWLSVGRMSEDVFIFSPPITVDLVGVLIPPRRVILQLGL